MSIFGLPVILFKVGVVACCQDSSSVVIFPNDTRTGTETFILDTKQATKIYFFIDYVSGTGSGTMTLQVKNDITGNWQDVIVIGTFNTIAEILDTILLIQPDNNLTRIEIVTTGSWVGSVGALLVDSKFT